MSRYLVVAHETVTHPRLVERVQQIAQQDPQAEFSVLVPATPVRHLVLRRGGGDERAVAVARRRADEAIKVLEGAGLRVVEATVGDPSPLEAIAAELGQNPSYAGFVISTLPKEQSRWLRQQLPAKVKEAYGLPVHHVELPPDELDYVLP